MSDSDSLLRLSDVARLTGLAEDAVRRLVRQGVVPPPLRLGPRSLRWRRTDVAFLARDPHAARDRAKGLAK